MKEKIKNLLNYFYQSKYFIWVNKIPYSGWFVEIISGLLLMFIINLLFKGFLPEYVIVIIALFVSLFYETELDPNGWSWEDYLQRSIGILLAILFLFRK